MTILTKAVGDKKIDKSDLPLVAAVDTGHDDVKNDVESSIASIEERRIHRARRVSTATTLCLFLTALLVLSIGVIGGVYIYSQYARARMHRFHGWCNIPYDGTKATMYIENNLDDAIQEPRLASSDMSMNSMDMDLGTFFKEEFDLDIEDENYEKIDVPDFRGGRRGRFIHDFNANKTGIIDMDGHRCFVMPLNRDAVLPPRSLFDLIHKMWDGYYEVNTDVVRETMRVILPPLTDLEEFGTYISKECKDLPTYQLEKYVGGVFKRSIDLHENAKFAQYAGLGITELDIVNIEDAWDHEKSK
uniref:Integral membrane protein 2 n=1 Tax=Xenopsylla cheopis TaxID=163159 RepID=A0A6M2DHU4_XENCH